MTKFFSSRSIIAIIALLFVLILSLNLSGTLSAQNSNRAFIDFLKPYVNTEISSASQRGNSSSYNDIAILKEVGVDYIIVEIKPASGSSSTEVISLHSIYSITLGDKPQIRFNR
jgi:hypothetical protein